MKCAAVAVVGMVLLAVMGGCVGAGSGQRGRSGTGTGTGTAESAASAATTTTTTTATTTAASAATTTTTATATTTATTTATATTTETASVPVPVPDLILHPELPYPPGRRTRSGGAVADSDEDATIALWNHGGLDATFPTSTDSHGHERPFHAAPRVRVDVQRVSGKKTDRREVERVARSKGYWPLRLCFEQGLRQNQKLSGTVGLTVELAASGSAKRVLTRKGSRASGSTPPLKDEAVVACVRDAVKTIPFGRMPRKGASATLEVSLWPGDAPVYEPADATGTKTFDAAALARALDAKLADVRACYAAGLAAHPSLWGRLAVRLAFDADGRVTDAREIESRFPDESVSRCVLDALKTTALAEPGAPFEAVWPLRLGRLPSSRAEAAEPRAAR